MSTIGRSASRLGSDGVSLPAGFRGSGVGAGIKASGGTDLALIVNDGPHFAAAAVFTSNRIQAAPVTWSRQVLADGRVDAVVLNSGGANACTGPRGFIDAHHMAEKTAAVLDCSAADVVVCSTGLIGELLPMDKVLPGIDAAAASLDVDGHHRAATAIMTTDTVAKECTHTTGEGWSISGMAKGAGMLAPSLATMLVVLTTDALMDAADLDAALRTATSLTFDRLDSDGCQSTNDTVLIMASGASGIRPSQSTFTDTLTGVCVDLACQLLTDAEGSHHDIEIDVRSAASVADALEVARSIARNNLFKCAIFGGDPNWGRILAAVGTTAAAFEPDHIDVSINGVQVCRAGAVGADRSKVVMTGRDVHVLVDLHAGIDSATVWTNDLTTDYVHENSAYSS